MASIAIMVGGAILNAAASLAATILPNTWPVTMATPRWHRKRGMTKALETYQSSMAKYTRERTQLLNWIETNREIKDQAKQNFTNTDYMFKLYNQVHPDYPLTMPKEPKFSDMYQPSRLQKQGELLFVGGSALALGFVAFRFL